MKFFKRKSKKQAVEAKQHPSIPLKREELQTDDSLKKASNECLLQLSIIGDFSSAINIPHLSEEENIDTNVKKIDTVNVKNTLMIPSSLVDKEDSLLQPSSSSIAKGHTEEIESNGLEGSKETDHVVLVGKYVSILNDITGDECQNNAGDSLTNSEGGDFNLMSDKRISPLLSFESEVLEKPEDAIIVKEKNYVSSGQLDTLIYEDKKSKNGEAEENIVNTPDGYPKKAQLVTELQQNISTITLDRSTIKDGITIANKILTKPNEYKVEIMNENLESQLQELESQIQTKEVDSLEILDHIPNELSSVKLTSVILQQSNQDNSADEMDLSEVIQTSGDNNECIVGKIETSNDDTEENNGKIKVEEDYQKTNLTTKRKSTHSFIPRKQTIQNSNFVEKEPAQTNEPTNCFSVTSPLSPSSSSRDIQEKELNSVTRRRSSSSFIPVPQQQNKLSLVIADTNINGNNSSTKGWSPSSSFDSLEKKSSRAMRSSESTSSSGESDSSNIVIVKKKVPSPTKKATCINGGSIVNPVQTSKIPVFATSANNQQNDILKAPSSSISHINVMSKLPVKINTTAV